jgi:hypothetical protein
MTEPNAAATTPAALPIDVTPSAASLQVKAQLRILLAAVAGALVGKHILPAGIINDTLLDALAAMAMIGLASAWQWARVRLQHSRLWSLAINRRVPDDLVRPATPIIQGEAP